MVLTSNFYCFIPKCFLFEKHFSFLSVLAEVPLNPVQDGGQKGGQKGGPTSSSAVTSIKVGIRSQNFLTFSFNSFDILV